MKKQTPKKHHQVKIIDGEKYYKPYCEDAKQKIEEYKVNQIVHFNPVGETDWRSVRQLGLYFQACKFVSERADGENFTNYKKVNVFTKAQCDLYDWDSAIKNIQGDWIYAPLQSIAFHNMPHLKACGFFKEAYPVMAGVTPGYGYDVERFIEDVKESCKGRR
jgi:hypothetical protein